MQNILDVIAESVPLVDVGTVASGRNAYTNIVVIMLNFIFHLFFLLFHQFLLYPA